MTLETYRKIIGKAYMSALYNHPYTTYKAAKTASKALEPRQKATKPSQVPQR